MITPIKLIDEVADYLVQKGYGIIDTQATATITTTTHISVLRMAETPDKFITVYSTGGMIIDKAARRLDFQITVRDKNAKPALTTANSIYLLLHNAVNTLDGGCLHGRIDATSEPGQHFLDENKRFMVPINFVFLTTWGA